MAERFRRLLPVVPALWILVAGIAAGAEEPALSRAQVLLFDTNHLEAVGPGQRLHYRFVRQGGAEPGFEDGVTETVTGETVKGAGPAGKDLSFEFLSGDRRIDFPPVEGFTGNPVLMLFLERDIREMGRRTGLRPLYFQNRIRYAFRDDAVVEPARQDGEVEITLAPFAKDPLRDRLGPLADKRYSFMLSPAAPGWIERISTVTPGPDGQPPIREELTLDN